MKKDTKTVQGLTARETAEALGVPTSMAYALMNEGVLVDINPSGLVTFDRAAVMALKAKGRDAYA